MQIEISEQASKSIQAALGSSDQAVVSHFVERIALDEQLLLSLLVEPPSESDLQALREAIDEADAGLGRPFSEFDQEFRKEMGFAPRANG